MTSYTQVDFITDDTEPKDRSPLAAYEGEGRANRRDFFARRLRDGTLILHLQRGLALVYGDELRWLPTSPQHGDVVSTRRDFRERTHRDSAYVWIVDADHDQPGRWERVPGHVALTWLQNLRDHTVVEEGVERPMPPLNQEGIRAVYRMAWVAVDWSHGMAEAEGLLGDKARELAKSLDAEVLALSAGTATTGPH